MLEEAPVLGGEGCLDHDVGNLVEWHGVVAQQAALANLVAVAIEEGDAVLVGEVHLALRDFEGREREGCEHEESARAEREPFAGELVQSADETFHLKLVEEGRVTAPPVEETGPRVVEARVDPGIDLQPVDELGPMTLENVPQL